MKETTRLTGVIIVALFVCCVGLRAANAATIQGFESGLPVGSTTGDASVQGTYEGIAPPEGSNQLLLTTINQLSDGVPPISGSGNDASTVQTVNTFVGLPTNSVALSFDPTHTGQEGSAFAVSLSLNVGDVITFQYDFLTSEDPEEAVPHQDFGFATLLNSLGTLVNYQLLGHQTTATTSTGQAPFFNETGTAVNHFSTYTFNVATAGTYTLGIGVMDAKTTDNPSALLVDNISVSPVPEPGAIALVVIGAGLVGLLRARREV